MHLEKFWLDQIQNGPLSAIICFHKPNILQAVLDASPLLKKKKCKVSGEDAPLNFLTSPYWIQNDRKSAVICLDWPEIG